MVNYSFDLANLDDISLLRRLTWLCSNSRKNVVMNGDDKIVLFKVKGYNCMIRKTDSDCCGTSACTLTTPGAQSKTITPCDPKILMCTKLYSLAM